MSFPEPQPTGPQTDAPTPTPYKASWRSRLIVWTIAAIILGALGTMIGVSAFRATGETSRENGAADACQQEALRQVDRAEASKATFSHPDVTLNGDRAQVDGAISLPSARRPYRCYASRSGESWTVMEFRFTQ